MEKDADIIETAEMPLLDEIVVMDELGPSEDMVLVEEPAAAPEKEFHWDENKDFSKFLGYLQGRIGKIPPHSGKTTAGCERAIVYLKLLDKEISKAVGEDLDCKVDDQEVEKLRKQIRKMIKQLQKRHDEINEAYDADDGKVASAENQMVKEADGMWKCPECGKDVPGDAEHKARHNAMEHGHEADDKKEAHVECACQVEKTAAPDDGNCPTCNIKLWATDENVMECILCEAVFEKKLTKEAHTAKLTLIMTPFERAVTGAIVNGFVSGGKNPEEIYEHFKKKYSFTDRDELSIQQILYDMGYPMLKDRGHLGDKSEQLNKGMGIEFSTQYNA